MISHMTFMALWQVIGSKNTDLKLHTSEGLLVIQTDSFLLVPS